MNRDLQGHYISISTVAEKAQAFVPAPLPPASPIEWSSDLREKFDQALLSLGRLDSVSVWLPDTSLFLYMYLPVTMNMAKGNFCFAPLMYLEQWLKHIDAMPQRKYDEIINSNGMVNAKKQSVLQKIAAFVEKFKGVGGKV